MKNKEWKNYKFHELCMLLPVMEDDKLNALQEDIEKYGQRDTIKLYKGKILDGKNRQIVMKVLDVEPKYEELPEDTNIAAYIRSTQIHRRNITIFKRIEINDKLDEFEDLWLKEQKIIDNEKDDVKKKLKSVALEDHKRRERSNKSNVNLESLRKYDIVDEISKIDPDVKEVFEKAKKGKISSDKAYKKAIQSEEYQNITGIKPKTKQKKKEKKDSKDWKSEYDKLKGFFEEVKEKAKELGVWDKIIELINPKGVSIKEGIFPTPKEIRKSETKIG